MKKAAPQFQGSRKRELPKYEIFQPHKRAAVTTQTTPRVKADSKKDA